MPQKKPAIGFLTTDWSWGTEPLQMNGCAWYRCKLPGDQLSKRGWKAAVGMPSWNDKYGFGMLAENNASIHGWDIVVFKLIMSKDALMNMEKARELNQKIVVDVDDWFVGLDKANRAYEVTDPKKNPDNNREIYEKIIMEAFAVICSTKFLYDYYSKIRDNVFLVRNGIDLDRWRIRVQSRQHKKLKVGWVGATPWRSNDLEQLARFLPDFVKSNNLLFHHSGHTINAPKANELLGIPDELTTLTPLVPILSYPGLFLPIDIGIVPLNNVDFNSAKSYIKGLEYAAAGVPFIASPSPEYELLAARGIGRIARSDSDWVSHLSELTNRKMLYDEAMVNRELLSDFSMNATGADWDATMRCILEKSM